MNQRITIKIMEQEYIMNAPTPVDEENIRLAASIINKKINGFTARYPGRSMTDILSFVALNESISSISLQRKLNDIRDETESLQRDIDNYFNDITK